MLRLLREKYQSYKAAGFNKDKYIEEIFLTADGTALVDIRLDSIDSALSSFAQRDRAVIDEGLASYIDGQIYNIPLKNPIVLHFHLPCARTEQREILVQAIKNHYGLILEDKRQDLQTNLLTIIALFLAGVLLLAFSYYLSSNNMGQLFTDIINIAGTFSLWEMVDLYLLDRRQKRIDKLNAAQTYTAKIVFSGDEEG